ncbi:hypothetical protein ZWY2020_046775 [Hordeum vulgare]|nr:hypothetical protein ZWY2020_046775 [Hordeum vulgare]
MHPELKAYLYDYHARTMARYDAVDRQSAQMLKILTRVSTPQPACPMGTTIDDGLTENAGVLAVVLNVSSTTTQAQEPAACVHDAPSVCIEMVPITCSTECLTHVTSIASVDEVSLRSAPSISSLPQGRHQPPSTPAHPLPPRSLLP